MSVSAGALAPLLVLVVVLATDAWVYMDATAQENRGTPVIFSFGSFVVETPAAWFLASLVMWIVFFPIYLAGRRHHVTKP